MKIKDFHNWRKRNTCRTFHTWVTGDNREENIDAILENREIDYYWYCKTCDKKYPKSKYPRNGTSDTGPL
tara:strand:- start:20332 stop:20541 length:210 start_codon:yes stop_codon:yes gene_type:complete